MSKGKNRSGARPGRTQPFLCTKVKRKPAPPLFPYTTLFRSRGCLVFMSRSSPKVRRYTHGGEGRLDRKSTRLNSSHVATSYAVFCLKKKTKGKKRSGARPGRPQPLRGTKGKRKGASLWYVGG